MYLGNISLQKSVVLLCIYCDLYFWSAKATQSPENLKIKAINLHMASVGLQNATLLLLISEVLSCY